MFGRIKTFFQETRQELRHVNWPTRQEAVRLTAFVVILSIALALFLGAFDYLFTFMLKKFILKV
ncbi:MAG TPA: preprotein translocase subunit SecE [Candidatus Paceibacterota bacterium]|nr:preprotein translocase subunit SecE [Candidatus Paceibacterota bacterium]